MRSLGPVVCFVLLALSHGADRYRRIIGGTEMNPGEYPWLISLWYMPDNIFTEHTKLHHVCGGALIAPNIVLTAAQCFEDRLIDGLENIAEWQVHGGEFDLRKEEPSDQMRLIKSLHKYPHWIYSPTRVTGDAAILVLQEPFDMTMDNIGLISWDTYQSCPQAGAECTVAGWGQIAEAPYGYGVDTPRAVDVAVVDLPTCQAAMAPEHVDGVQYYIDDSILCAGTNGSDACAGDAGSPLVCHCGQKEVVSGIVSYGHGCGRVNLFGLYTKVFPLDSWIKNIVDNN